MVTKVTPNKIIQEVIMKKDKSLKIRIDDKLLQDIKSTALDQDVPYSQLIRHAIKKYIQQLEGV
ncbi:CopG family antitoxin [Deinococcus ficus]|uniref:CopG family antitoxin n=1 Tax=Deinococcus ficus TaxID=317577 RepID=UPI00174C1C80|nr:CopG family antitoxin [Deinococcus ficus]GHF91377.1 hypothetical protein GCM10017782_30360 [Deinococcus ficus]